MIRILISLILCRFFIIESYKLHHTRVVVLPGYGCNSNDYNDIVKNCEKRNIEVDVVPISRLDWLKPFKGMFNKKFWTYDLTPDDTFDWYLNKARNTLEESFKKNNNNPVILCGHSAGGWLARALMQNKTIYGTNNLTYSYVSALVTMGTPNIINNIKTYDTTRGCLTYVNKHYPGAYFHKQGIKYITLGSYSKKVDAKNTELFSKNRIILNSYLTVLGNHSTPHYIYGDGMVPLDACHLDNSIKLTFNDVFHFKRDKKRWYGDESVINTWLHYLNVML